MKTREIQKREMMQEADATILFNRTGIMTNPELSAELVQGTKKTIPSSHADGKRLLEMRTDRLQEDAPLGSCPVIVTNGFEKAQEELSAEADRKSVLLDKLGERLAFERQGTRLYEAFMQKLDAAPVEDENPDGPSMEELRHIHDEELEHFKLLQKTISAMGGDATVQTPSADVAGVLSHGILQIVGDPRTTIPQMLQALLNAELSDNDGWQLLRELAEELGHGELGTLCAEAFEEEQEHLQKVRAWLSQAVAYEAKGEQAFQGASRENGRRAGASRRRTPARAKSAKRSKRKK
jgi:hypothetical protein